MCGRRVKTDIHDYIRGKVSRESGEFASNNPSFSKMVVLHTKQSVPTITCTVLKIDLVGSSNQYCRGLMTAPPIHTDNHKSTLIYLSPILSSLPHIEIPILIVVMCV